VMFSNSRAARDVETAHNLGAAGFFHKPGSLEAYIVEIRNMARYRLFFPEETSP